MKELKANEGCYYLRKSKEGCECCNDLFFHAACPYGQPGDRLYVKEAHYRYGRWYKNGKTKTGRQRWRFRASSICNFIKFLDDPPAHIGVSRASKENDWWKRSPLFMPKKYSRLWLELTAVRVERLQEISEEDCQVEGIEWMDNGLGVFQWTHDGKGWFDYATDCYRDLFESINGKGSWEQNPWVWVLTFKRVEEPDHA